jgi:hypothetical protein
MKKMKAAAVVAVILALILVVPLFSAAAAKGPNGTPGDSPPISTDAVKTKMVKLCYYVTGGNPQPIALCTTAPGPVYIVPNDADVVVKATGYFKGTGGLGLLEIWNTATEVNYVTRLVPSDKTMTATMPAAIYVKSGDSYPLGACISGPGWNGYKEYFFQIVSPI